MKRLYTFRLFVLGAIMIYAFWRYYRVSHDMRYTVATTTGRISTPRNHEAIEYRFSVNYKTYNSSGPVTGAYHILCPNGRYYVKFPFKSPGANEIRWDKPVPDSIYSIPEEGWKEIP
jgi:hypothetical protein